MHGLSDTYILFTESSVYEKTHSTWPILRIKNNRKVFPSVSSSLKFLGEWLLGLFFWRRRWLCRRIVFCLFCIYMVYELNALHFIWIIFLAVYEVRVLQVIFCDFVRCALFFCLLINFLFGFLECASQKPPH